MAERSQIRRGEYRFKGGADAQDLRPGLRAPHAHRRSSDGDVVDHCHCPACEDYWESYFATRKAIEEDAGK